MIKLRKTIEATKLSNPELSIKLGHSRKYLTNLLNDGCSTELQNRLIEEINQVMAGTFKTDAEVIAELTEKLDEAQQSGISLLESLNKSLDENKDLRKTITKYDMLVDKKSEDETKLLKENQTLRKNAQEIDTELKSVKDDLDYIKEENDQLLATASKQNALNESLNDECNKYRAELQQLGKEFHYARSELSKVDAKNDELTEQLSIKNHGEITMNQTIHKLRQSQKIHRLLSLVCLATIILLIIIKWGV